MNYSKLFFWGICTGVLSVIGLAYLSLKQDMLFKKRYCKAHERTAPGTNSNDEVVTEVIREVPVQVLIPQETVLFSETKPVAVQFFAVKCLFGHVGRNKATVKELPIRAKNAKEAAEKARNTPRVKHDAKNAILCVRRIDDKEFKELQRNCHHDPYFHCTNRQQQRAFEEHMKIFEIVEERKLYKKKHSLRKTYNFQGPWVERLQGDISCLDIA